MLLMPYIYRRDYTNCLPALSLVSSSIVLLTFLPIHCFLASINLLFFKHTHTYSCFRTFGINVSSIWNALFSNIQMVGPSFHSDICLNILPTLNKMVISAQFLSYSQLHQNLFLRHDIFYHVMQLRNLFTHTHTHTHIHTHGI